MKGTAYNLSAYHQNVTLMMSPGNLYADNLSFENLWFNSFVW